MKERGLKLFQPSFSLRSQGVISQSLDQGISNEQEQLLWSGIMQLGKLDRALIILNIDGLSYEEMSDIMGHTVSNVVLR
jgi:RNA polymerase sigma-70 factor (ECF subfamily)